jgi:hypothetical protein
VARESAERKRDVLMCLLLRCVLALASQDWVAWHKGVAELDALAREIQDTKKPRRRNAGAKRQKRIVGERG